jgi:hypothetical protein
MKKFSVLLILLLILGCLAAKCEDGSETGGENWDSCSDVLDCINGETLQTCCNVDECSYLTEREEFPCDDTDCNAAAEEAVDWCLNSETDAGGDADTDTDTDTDADSTMTDCVGGKYDPDSNLCWQDPPSANMNWYIAAGVYHATYNSGTEDYCPTLGSSWRLPTISELRSLVRGCTPIEWDMAWTSVPDETCGVWGDCLTLSPCGGDSLCLVSECVVTDGPGAEGCYSDPALSGTCNYLWSSSERADLDFDGAWYVSFKHTTVSIFQKNSGGYVRCVRTGP